MYDPETEAGEMALIRLVCEPGDMVYIPAQDTEAMVIEIKITSIGTKIIAKNRKDVWEFWDIEVGKDFIVKRK